MVISQNDLAPTRTKKGGLLMGMLEEKRIEMLDRIEDIFREERAALTPELISLFEDTFNQGWNDSKKFILLKIEGE